jgi:hypothetical protein
LVLVAAVGRPFDRNIGRTKPRDGGGVRKTTGKRAGQHMARRARRRVMQS